MINRHRSPAPRPWYEDGELANLARARHARRDESALRLAEWLNVAEQIRADVAAGARYPADVLALVREPSPAVIQLTLWPERRAA